MGPDDRPAFPTMQEAVLIAAKESTRQPGQPDCRSPTRAGLSSGSATRRSLVVRTCRVGPGDRSGRDRRMAPALARVLRRFRLVIVASYAVM
jgi:hypothetical protein